MQFHVQVMNGFYNNSHRSWQIIRDELPIILLRLQPDSSKNSSPIAYSTMKTNELLLCEFFAPANIFNVLTKLSLIPPFLPDHRKLRVLINITMQHLENQFARTYPWAVGKGKSLPAGYILPKGKKQYGSGRPIIGFFNAPFKPMLSTLAKLLFQVVPRACPEHFAHGDVYQLLKLLRDYATTMADKALRIYNQDLSGFFISIDSDRFIQSWYMLLRFLEPSMSVNENEFFSVSPVKQNNPGDIIKGKTFRTLNANRHIRIGDIPDLIIAALQMQNFQLGSKVYTQVQGSPMGSPLSPALCLMVVSVYEQIWYHTHRESISNLHVHALFLRYVDNRLVILPSSNKDLPAFQILVDPHFLQSSDHFGNGTGPGIFGISS